VGPETVPVDDWPNNVLHSRLHAAADRADRAVEDEWSDVGTASSRALFTSSAVATWRSC